MQGTELGTRGTVMSEGEIPASKELPIGGWGVESVNEYANQKHIHRRTKGDAGARTLSSLGAFNP